MALAASLIPGFKYRVLKGMYEDEIVTIVDNTIIRAEDDPVNQRKIQVAGPHGEELFILPRLLADRPEDNSLDNTPPPSLVSVAPVTLVNEATVPVMTQESATALIESHKLLPITDPMDPRLDHLRPDRAKVKAYINRIMANGLTDVETLLMFTSQAYRKKNRGYPANVMLKGDTQSGKTMLVEVLAVLWADLLGLPKPMPVFTLSGSSGITDFDLFGQTTAYTDPDSLREMLVWLTGLVDLASCAGGILYLDECNMFGERVTSSLHPLADHRHAFTNRNKAVWRKGQFMPDHVVAHPDLWIIGTYNEGYRGASEMNEAFINRFRHIRWDYDKAVEAKLIDSPAILLLGDALRTARAANQLRTPVGTSALQHLEEDIQEMGIAMGVNIFTGMFKANEIPVVEEILESRSIFVMLQEEARQAEANEKAAAD